MGATAPLLVALIGLPPVVHGLGPARFGMLGILWVVFAYLAVLDLGIGRAMTRFAAEAMSRRDMRLLGGVARTACTAQIAIAILSAIALVGLAPLIVRRLLNVDAAFEAEAVLSLRLLGLAAPVVMVNNTFRGLLEAGQRFGIVNMVRAPVGASNILVPWLGVTVGWGLPMIVGMMIVARAIGLSVMAVVCVRAWPALLHSHWLPRDRAREVVAFGGWMTIATLISPILVYLDRFAIGSLAGIAAVGFYAAPHEMAMRLVVLPGSLVTALYPALSRMLAQGTAPGALVARSLKFLLIIMGPVVVVTIAVAPEILRLWLGAEFAAASGMALRLLAAGMLAYGLSYVAYAMLHAAGRSDLTARTYLTELPVYAVVLVMMTARWGITGAALAWLLRALIDCAVLLSFVFRLRLAETTDLRAVGLGRTFAGIAVLAAGVGLAEWAASGPLVAVIAALLVAAVWAAAAWPLLLGAEERAGLLRILGLPMEKAVRPRNADM